jgi:hypothetical protein
MELNRRKLPFAHHHQEEPPGGETEIADHATSTA